VLTNSPDYPWHLINLGNYVTHSTKPVESMTIGELEVTPLGAGSGMLGLPGDYTPPSRFIRAAALRNTVPPLKTGARAVEEVFRILNNFDIPTGSMGVDEEDPSILGDTQWTSVADTQALLYYYRTMNNHRIRVVDLKAIDFSKGEIRSQPLDPELEQDYQKVVVE
jgi:choloylglycine hydrolase